MRVRVYGFVRITIKVTVRVRVRVEFAVRVMIKVRDHVKIRVRVKNKFRESIMAGMNVPSMVNRTVTVILIVNVRVQVSFNVMKIGYIGS